MIVALNMQSLSYYVLKYNSCVVYIRTVCHIPHTSCKIDQFHYLHFRWFAGRIARNRAERLVLASNLPKGTFLIREREADTREYALTIRDSDDQRGGTVKHYKIKRFVFLLRVHVLEYYY